jgi:hypothetical protein
MFRNMKISFPAENAMQCRSAKRIVRGQLPTARLIGLLIGSSVSTAPSPTSKPELRLIPLNLPIKISQCRGACMPSIILLEEYRGSVFLLDPELGAILVK